MNSLAKIVFNSMQLFCIRQIKKKVYYDKIYFFPLCSEVSSVINMIRSRSWFYSHQEQSRCLSPFRKEKENQLSQISNGLSSFHIMMLF